MIYLIQHQFWYLVLAFAFAGLAGWAWAGLRTQKRIDGVARERERLMRDLLAAGDDAAGSAGPSPELDRQMDALKLRADMAQARVTELERTAESARARAEEATGRVAELERAVERHTLDTEELARLREQTSAHDEQSRRTLDVEVAPTSTETHVETEDRAAQNWRLRYFEQRVRYLEGQARATAENAVAVAAPVEPRPADQQLEWRVRMAEAQVRELEEQLRSHSAQAVEAVAAPVAGAAPVVEPAEDDTLMRWRSVYLEKRVAHLRDQGSATAAAVMPAPISDADHEAELAKWRARYLEARVRHLEARVNETPESQPEAHTHSPEPVAAASTPQRDVEPEEAPAPAPLVPAGSEERPQALPAAQSGAPDDFSLIDGVSHMLQSTLNSLGVYHFEQIARWTPANIAWVDQYLRLRGRIMQEDWVGQAQRLERDGPMARVLQDENA